MSTCTECEAPVKARGYCNKHYHRWKKYGDPSIVLAPYNATPRTYSLDEDYFEKIDTPEKAYWLGLLTADGSLSYHKGWTIALELNKRDIALVERFRESVSSNAPIRDTRKDCVRLRINSNKMGEDLGNLGVHLRKTLKVTPPVSVVEGEYGPSYWRGLFDGDGCIHKRNLKLACWDIIIVGSLGCVEGFADWGRRLTGCTKQVSNKNSKNPDFWRWDVGGSKKPLPLAQALSAAGVGIGLERKQAKLDELCEFNYEEYRIKLNEGRAAKMRDAWATGRHPRSLKGGDAQ